MFVHFVFDILVRRSIMGEERLIYGLNCWQLSQQQWSKCGSDDGVNMWTKGGWGYKAIIGIDRQSAATWCAALQNWKLGKCHCGVCGQIQVKAVLTKWEGFMRLVQKEWICRAQAWVVWERFKAITRRRDALDGRGMNRWRMSLETQIKILSRYRQD